MLEIIQVIRKFLFGSPHIKAEFRRRRMLYLGKARDTGLYEMPRAIVRDAAFILFGKMRYLGPWPDKGKIAAKDIEELGEFVYLGFPQKTP